MANARMRRYASLLGIGNEVIFAIKRQQQILHYKLHSRFVLFLKGYKKKFLFGNGKTNKFTCFVRTHWSGVAIRRKANSK